MDSPVDASSPPVPFIDLAAQHGPIADKLIAVTTRILDSGQFVLGQEVADFESEIAAYCDAAFAVGCASGTDALILSLMALEIGPGDEVITSPFTFFATAGAIHRTGATPVFVDIEPGGFNIDADAVADAITPNTRAIIPVHLFGQTADMDVLWRTAVAHNIPIIEDACQAIGATFQGRRTGVLGKMGCFSFFPTKNLGGAGDGGIITLDDEKLAQQLRQLRMHGDTGGYQHTTVGLNSRLDALQAAILRVKLVELEDWTRQRIAAAADYDRLLSEHRLTDRIAAPVSFDNRRHVFNQYTIRVAATDRDRIVSSLRDDGIGCAVYYPLPLHRQPCFQALGYPPGSLPESEAAATEVISLPIAPGLDTVARERVIDRLAAACGGAACKQRRAA